MEFVLKQSPGCSITRALGLSHGFFRNHGGFFSSLLFSLQFSFYYREDGAQKTRNCNFSVTDMPNCQHSFHGYLYLVNITDSQDGSRWKGPYRNHQVPRPLPQAGTPSTRTEYTGILPETSTWPGFNLLDSSKGKREPFRTLFHILSLHLFTKCFAVAASFNE